MIDVTASVTIDAPPAQVWSVIERFEEVWEPSNPDHDGTWVVMNPKIPLRDGLRFYQREKVGPVTGHIKADIRDVVEEKRFSWIGTCIYELGAFPVTLTIEEGGTVSLEATPDGTKLSHRVWGRFPKTLWGRLVGEFLTRFVDVNREAYQHTLVELEYFKDRVEADSNEQQPR